MTTTILNGMPSTYAEATDKMGRGRSVAMSLVWNLKATDIIGLHDEWLVEVAADLRKVTGNTAAKDADEALLSLRHVTCIGETRLNDDDYALVVFYYNVVGLARGTGRTVYEVLKQATEA